MNREELLAEINEIRKLSLEAQSKTESLRRSLDMLSFDNNIEYQ